MENVVLSLLINGMMAILLLVTIIYCGRLNKRIRVLQDSKSELGRIIREFNESTERATQSIADIHEATTRISENIQHKIDKANYLATDLDMLIEKGGRLAGHAPASGRAEAPVQPVSSRRSAEPVAARVPQSAMTAAAGDVGKVAPLVQPEAAPRRGVNRPRSKAEQEILNVLQSKN